MQKRQCEAGYKDRNNRTITKWFTKYIVTFHDGVKYTVFDKLDRIIFCPTLKNENTGIDLNRRRDYGLFARIYLAFDSIILNHHGYYKPEDASIQQPSTGRIYVRYKQNLLVIMFKIN